MFNVIDPIDDDGTLLGFRRKQLLVEPVHSVLVMLHDVHRVIVSTNNPYGSGLRAFVLDECGRASHVIDWFTHDVKIKGKKRGGTFARTPLLTYKPICLERDAFCILRLSRVVSTLLSCVAVRIPHTQAWLSALGHEESEPNVTALTASITRSGVLVNAVLQFVVLETEAPSH